MLLWNKTSFFVKPHALELADPIIDYLEFCLKESSIYTIKNRKKASITPEFIMEFYSHVKDINFKNFEEMLRTYVGIVDLAVIYGDNIIRKVRDIAGPTNYGDNSSLTIRGKFGRILYGEKGYVMPNTIVHASSSEEVERDFRILKKYNLID